MPKRINQDGKRYTFIPGPGGSLTAPAPKASEFKIVRDPVAKSVPSIALDKAAKRRKKKDTKVASVRG